MDPPSSNPNHFHGALPSYNPHGNKNKDLNTVSANLFSERKKCDLLDALNTPGVIDAVATLENYNLGAVTEGLIAELKLSISNAIKLQSSALRLEAERRDAQAALLALHALERQWQTKQREIDHALQNFSPSSLYQQLVDALDKQQRICGALEESLVGGQFKGMADTNLKNEGGLPGWVNRYRMSRKLFYSRKERKMQWDQGGVGGWP